MTRTISPQEALVYIMVTMSAADQQMTDSELKRIGTMTSNLPIFHSFDQNKLVKIAEECGEIMSAEDGLEEIIDLVLKSIPTQLYDTAYAVAVEVAVADLHVEQEELRLLQIYQDALNIDKLTSAAIERGARARFRTLS